MGLISPGGENFLDFLELRQVFLTFDGDLRDTLWWPQERPVPMRVVRGPLGIFSRRCRGLRPCVESVPEPEDSSPVLNIDLGVLLESPQGSQSSSRVGACRCAFLPSSSSSVVLPFVWIKGSVVFPRGYPRGFPRGFPTGLSHMPPWCDSILGLNVQAVQGKQVSLEWTETSGCLWEWWHDPGVPLAFPVESASS